ncbi:MAG: ABC transporter permease [Nitratireductor sp.]|nr:ABC transporter permease [Nitratireductor sp.]
MFQRLLRAAAVIGVLLLCWQVAIWFFRPPGFLLPAPAKVGHVFISQPGHIGRNALTTIGEMLLGLVIGGAAGMAIAIVLARSPLMERYLLPVVVTTQTLPVFAIAPVLVIWFGLGIGSKIVMASLIIFFPVASALYDGLRRTPQTWLDLAESWGATRRQVFWRIRFPGALPSLVTGLKLAAVIAPIGAVVGEWAGAAGGLGFVMLQANARTQMDVVFAALIVLAVCAFVLRYLVSRLGDRLIWWAIHAEN